jgi:hypothetical protein
LQPERKIFRAAQIGKIALAAFLIVTFLASLLLAASPSLHEKLHPNASEASHQCVITTFQQHQLLASNPTPILVELNSGFALLCPITEFIAPDETNFRFSASRAPPVSL